MMLETWAFRLLSRAVAAAAAAALCHAEPIDYPKTSKVEHVDIYHGVKVPDPYRWLEDENSPETAAWVAAQNKVTFSFLEKIPFRAALRKRLAELYDYPKYGAPERRGEQYFFTLNEGLQNQPVTYVQKGLEGKPEVLIDPNKFSTDGTTRMGIFSLSRDGRYAAYGISAGGSDWQVIRVLEVAARTTLPDELRWVKVSGVGWWGDGFFYSRYPAPEKGKELSSRNEFQAVYYHRIGTPQSSDELIYEDKAHPQRFHNVSTSEDQRFAILNISERGSGKTGNALFFRELSSPSRQFRPVVSEIGNANFQFVDAVGARLLIRTNRDAANGKVMAFDTAASAGSEWSTVVPEQPRPLQSVSSAGGKLFVSYLQDVTTRVEAYSLAGRKENEVSLPGPGTALGFRGRSDDKSVFYTFTTFNFPQTIYRYGISSRESAVFRAPQIPGFRPEDYETKEVFVSSKDGTRVPMFLVHRKGLKLDGTNPTLLYGYGGFNITTSPNFNSMRLALLERGFVYASANMRGGGEYGEQWHLAGTKLNKQNVFDDFIACAEWLIANKYTSRDKLAIQGGSNGGLLIGAVINQRPELFRAAIPQVGVMDMLRFHKFTIGWNWIADYGSSDNPEQFKALYAYSPLHNIRQGAVYPATLITTADHDDRVVPAHSFKYAATLQEKAAKSRPVLIRIETRSGHGASSTQKNLDLTADVYAFLISELQGGYQLSRSVN
jgi:prolyl oligopeptidase